MLNIIKWYLMLISIYFICYYFYFATKTERRDKIFPSLLDLMNYIRETKNDPDGFLRALGFITLIYSVPSAVLAFVLLVNGKLV